MKKLLLIATLTAIAVSPAFAQSTTTENKDDLYNMSLEDLMNVEIVSASRKNESLFDAPISSYSLTREEIERAGSTSIIEALRLVPGVIVRELSNGNYDVHLRGFDNIPAYQISYNASNLLTLVMIDNMPVFNYANGGTFWETIPIGLSDVERVEVVRGPAVPLFGPNAVTGVINFITRQAEEQGLKTHANVQYGTLNSLIGNAAVRFKPNDKFNVGVTGSFDQRNRHHEGIYSIVTGEKVQNPNDLLTIPLAQQPGDEWLLGFPLFPVTPVVPEEINGFYGDQLTSMNKYTLGVNTRYRVNDDIHFRLTAGLENSESFKALLGNDAGILGPGFSATQYVHLKGTIGQLKVNASTLLGNQDANPGSTGQRFKYDFNVINANAEYELQFGDRVSLTPGLSYQRATYDDTEITTEMDVTGFLNGRKTQENYALSVRADIRPTEQLRFVAGVRADAYTEPDDIYTSYQFAGTYNITDNQLIRGVYSRSYSSSYITNVFTNLQLDTGIPVPVRPEGQSLPQVYNLITAIQGGNSIQLPKSDMIEMGYRGQLLKNLRVDIDLFTATIDNFVVFFTDRFEVNDAEQSITLVNEFANDNTAARQFGTTISLNYVALGGDLQIKPFATIQSTRVTNYSRYFVNPGVKLPILGEAPSDSLNITRQQDIDNEATPAVYGGAYINYQWNNKLNINVNPYFFTEHRQKLAYENFPESYLENAPGALELGRIQPKVLLNARIGYKVSEAIEVYVNGRNVLNTQTREFWGTDDIGGLYLAGVNVRF